ncbi:CPBP family intramembrane glutamic endopeptidase [Hyphobacterium sp.]|uniref:CPBP family intramembrane glutamic endopeptidase n=1 Tax=Hyphobacterium sp. TaxID=2004662 RepID=UPI003747CE81
MTSPHIAFEPANRTFRIVPAFAGGLEVVLLIGASTGAAIMAQSLFTPSLGEALGLAGNEQNLLGGAWTMLRIFAIQYGVLIGLAALFGLLRGRRSLKSHALGKGNLSTLGILKWGAALGLIAGAPATLVLFLQDVAPFGQDTPVWAALREAPWDMRFWTFLFVGSFGLVPLLEEVTWRGYALGRMTEVIAPGAAILFTSVPFALLHVQYASTDPAMIATSISVMIVSLTLAFATLRTGTIWPAVIGHAITNFPADSWLGAVQLGLAVLVLIVFIRPIASEVGKWLALFFRWTTLQAFVALVPVIALAVLAMTFQANAMWIGLAAFVVTLGLGLIYRSAWRHKPA